MSDVNKILKTVNGVDFEIQKWTLADQIKNQNTILPFLSGPVASAVSMLDSGDESLMMAEALTGLTEALGALDATAYMEALFTSCVMRNEHGAAVMVSIGSLQDRGFEILDVYELCGHILFVQYESLLKKGRAVLEQMKGKVV